MATDYEPIAEQYKRSKLQPWRTHVESFSLMGLVGDLAGKSVIDLACGEGHYTRLLRKAGAAKVVGVDLSSAMIDLARRQETERPMGIEYVVGDGKDLQLSGEYDLVVAAYLLNYATNRDELRAMCQGAMSCLKPGGRFLAVNTNPGLDFRAAPSYRKYGVETNMPGDYREGSPINWTFHLEDGPIRVENYYLDTAIHETAFRSAGFREIHWHNPKLSPQGESEYGRGYWSNFLDHPPVILIECLK
jgi:ubiquinone/menaquinone biosynthesis C-methylase UbiE